MRIVGTHIQQILADYRAKAGKADAAAAPLGRTDEVLLSERAGEVLRARQAFDALPEVRDDRIAALREQIQSGTYQPDDTRIARALIAGGRPQAVDEEDTHA